MKLQDEYDKNYNHYINNAIFVLSSIVIAANFSAIPFLINPFQNYKF